MGIPGYYARITPAELDRARVDRVWRQNLVYERWQAEQERRTGHAGRGRGTAGHHPNGPGLPASDPIEAAPIAIATDKAWMGIFFVLAQAGLRRDLVDGRPISEEDEPPTPRFFSPSEVVEIADHLAGRSFAELVMAADPEAAVHQAGDWDDDARAFVSSHGEDLPAFFAGAAAAGDAVVVHIDLW